MVQQTPGHPVVTISERLRLSSGHPYSYDSVARPLRPQIKDGVVLESFELRALPGRRLNQVCGYNFLSRIQKPETVDFDIIC